MMIRTRTRRGAASMQYAMVVGLIAVVAIAAIAMLGATLSVMLSRTGNVMRDVSNGTAPVIATGGATTPTGIGIEISGGARRFADGSYATSCQGYFAPASGYSYTGETGDGLYTIKPGATAFQVTCGMLISGGGWTRIGSFTGTTSTELDATSRNAIPYRDVMISETPGNAVIKTVTCRTTAAAGFAADNSSGYNCSADGTLSIRVNQVGSTSSGNYGIYQGTLNAVGGCSWQGDVKVWGRHYQSGASNCVMKGSGETYTTTATWGSTSYVLWVR